VENPVPQAAPAVPNAPNRELFKKLIIITLMMFAFGYALVPIYKKICEVTGINSLVKPDVVAENTQVDTTRTVTIDFDSNISSHLPWRFKPLSASIKGHPGELMQVTYEVTNTRDHPVTGQAIPSYAPKEATKYFKKLECFCFRQQTLGPNETKQFPVTFVIDPELHQSIGTITLSYTFFEIAGGAKPS
jgi:cytochrome c oxidase assembly protein subunit 11